MGRGGGGKGGWYASKMGTLGVNLPLPSAICPPAAYSPLPMPCTFVALSVAYDLIALAWLVLKALVVGVAKRVPSEQSERNKLVSV